MTYRKKLIEVALPLDAINKESAREKSIRHGHPSTLHLWWARRPLAACRAVLFASLVDDPSNDLPEEEAKVERDRLFGILEELVKWENSNDDRVLERARAEIRRSCKPPVPPDTRDIDVIFEEAFNATGGNFSAFGSFNEVADLANARLDEYRRTGRWRGTLRELRACLYFEQRRWRHKGHDPEGEDLEAIRALYDTIRGRWDEVEPKLPPVLDPFCGGGSIPLEAQRLGLEAHGSDLNPVAVLITKALIEIPPKFAGLPPVNPEARGKIGNEGNWRGAKGLAEDVRYYGKWMRDEAEKRIGHLYPKGPNGETVIAWLWARTVRCPNPACGATMPLVSSFWLSKKQGKKAWVEPVVDREKKEVSFSVRKGDGMPPDPPKLGRGAKFRCLVCDQISEDAHIKAEGKAGRMGQQLMAVVAEAQRGREYVAPTAEHVAAAEKAKPEWEPDQELANDPRNIWCIPYGLTTFAELFTPRQVVALTTFSDLVGEARRKVREDAVTAGLPDDGVPLNDGGKGVQAYADAVATYLGMVVSKSSVFLNSLARWRPGENKSAPAFGRQAIPMVWDFVDVNPFAGAGGDFYGVVNGASKALANSPVTVVGYANQFNATASVNGAVRPAISTDPPYYDNIGYADLSDFFYVWLRRSLGKIHPGIFGTMLVPKSQELLTSA
jgi:putative DNA methylase